MEPLRLYLFGFPRMERAGQPVTVDTRKAIALLAYLAIHGEVVSRDALSNLLWPEYDQTGARSALRRTLSVLNKAVGEGVLLIERERVGLLREGAFWLDVQQFETGLQQAEEQRQAGSPAYLSSLMHGIQFYTDRFMAGFSLRDSVEFDDWQYFHSERLNRDLTRALDQIVNAYTAQGQHEKAITYARRLLALDPLREESYRQLMLLYARADQRSSALRQYRECVRVLDQELGVAPLDETTTLYQAILENRIPVDVPAPDNLPPTLSPRETAAPFPLVGRDAEWAQLQAAYDRAVSGGCVVALEGEAGIGKTRLANDFLEQAEAQGARVLRLRWYEGETGLAYGPFTQALARVLAWPEALQDLQSVSPGALAEAARLLPDLATRFGPLPEPSPLDGPGAQSRFYEDLRQVFYAVLAGSRPGILFLDDLQWADTASQGLLAYLVRRLGSGPLMVLLTLRSGVAPERNLPQGMLQDASRAGMLARVVLPRLDAGAVRELAQRVAEHAPLPSGVLDTLFRESEGLPFFAVEYLDALRKSPASEGRWEMPASVRELLMARLRSVDETARQLMSTAAVIGRSFDFSTLREVSGRSELETVTGLEGLLSAGLVAEHVSSEHGPETYDFTHEKLRDMAYEDTSLARRRLLHRRVAEVLSGPGGRREPGSQAGLIAYHFRLAGNAEAAAVYYRAAGDAARALYANAEAIEQYQAALASGHPEPADLHEAIGDLRTLQGEYSAAIASYESAAALCPEDQVGVLERKLGNVHTRLGEWELAESHYQRAAEAGVPDAAGLSADRSYAAFQRGQREQARALALRSLELARASGDPLALAQACNSLGMLDRAAGELDNAVEQLQGSLDAARNSGNLLAQAAALNNLSLALLDLDRLDEAARWNAEALRLCAQVGDRHREAALLNNLADLHHAAGREQDALDALKRAVLIFSEIGIEGSEMKPDIWKLTAW